jgi:hypothetical protein
MRMVKLKAKAKKTTAHTKARKTKSYLEMKNQFFYNTTLLLDRKGKLKQSLYLLVPDNDETDAEYDFFSLVALYFEDEDGRNRALFIPYPILKESKSKGAARIRKLLKQLPDDHIVSRAWHDYFRIEMTPPNSFKPKRHHDEDYEEEYDEDYNDDEY